MGVCIYGGIAKWASKTVYHVVADETTTKDCSKHLFFIFLASKIQNWPQKFQIL